MEQDEILKSDDKAAKYVTGLCGWVDRHGHYWGENEDLARYSGCTHITCDNCGVMRIRNGYCAPCHEVKRIEKFNALEKIEWDGKIPLYSDSQDEYFFDDGSLSDYIEEHEASIDDLQLRLCRPVAMQTLDESYFLDDMHEDAELPNDVANAIESLNKLILEQPTQTWGPDKYAAIVDL